MPFIAPMHTPPAWQTAPAQQAALTAPQLMHVLAPIVGLLQPRPLLHMFPAQQRSPEPPQGWQVAAAPMAPPTHASESRQVSALRPAQQASPWLPQATQTPPVQRVAEAVHVVPPLGPQQGCPTAPQAVPAVVSHEPDRHVPVMPTTPAQAAPEARHVPPTQQPSRLQPFAAQQAWPGLPQLVLPPPEQAAATIAIAAAAIAGRAPRARRRRASSWGLPCTQCRC
jgi:hypothetical protein